MTTSSWVGTSSIRLGCHQSCPSCNLLAVCNHLRMMCTDDRLTDLRGGKFWTRDGEFWLFRRPFESLQVEINVGRRPWSKARRQRDSKQQKRSVKACHIKQSEIL